MSDHRDATDEEAERAAAHVFKKHGVALQRLARIECAERLEYISRTFGKQGARTRTLLQAAAYLRGCTCVPAAPALPPDEMPVTITLERANQSAHAIRQWLDYGQQSFDAHHHVGDKSHAGYFSDGGWACEELKRLLVALTTAALPPVEAPMSSSGVSVPVEAVEGITVAGARAFWALKDLEAKHEALRVAVMVAVSDPHLDWPTARQALTNALNAAPPAPTGAPEYLPCQVCGGPHRYDTTVPSPLWNRVIRAHGLPEFLCLSCIVQAFAEAGENLTAELWGQTFNGTPLDIRLTAASTGAPADLVPLVLEFQAAEKAWGYALPDTDRAARRARTDRVQAAERAVLAWHPAAPALPSVELVRCETCKWEGRLAAGAKCPRCELAALPPVEADTRWFAERPHPTEPGMIHVEWFKTKAEAADRVGEWGCGHYWQPPTEAPVEADSTSIGPQVVGTWPEHCEQRAFVDGAAWLLWKTRGYTPWSHERDEYETEAVKRFGEPAASVEADTMPTIEVGDVLFLHEFGHLYGNHTEVTSKEIADWFNRPENIVVAIYRDPLWRRPAPTGGQ